MATTTKLSEISDDYLYNIFITHVRGELKQKVLEAIDRDIDEAVRKAVNSLEIKLQQSYEFELQQSTIRVILNDGRKKDETKR